jgi:phosphohistidine phosphatase
MEILLIRHGQAVDDAPGLGDAGRWLTAKGRRRTREVARWLARRRSTTPAVIWTSALVRAVQTAEIIAGEVGIEGDVLVRPELAPGGDEAALLVALARHEGKRPVALVGHEPQLSSLAKALLPGVEWPGFKKSGVLSVKWDGAGAAKLRFLLVPGKGEVLTELPRARGDFGAA